MKGRSNLIARRRFAQAMKARRQSQGLSQEALAELTGLHRTYIGSVERGERNISIDNMELIALALEIEIATLLQPDPGQSRGE